MNVAEAIEQRSLEDPHAIALVDGRRLISFAALDRTILQIGSTLMREGVSPGDIVAITMGQSALHVATLLALARIGAISVQLRPALPADARAATAARFGAKSLVADSTRHALPELLTVALDASLFEAREDAPRRFAAVGGGEDVWRIALSSGTTGAPKAIAVSHRRVIESAWFYASSPQTSGGARSLVYIDLNVLVGMHAVLRQLIAGRTAVLVPGATPALFFDAVDRHAVDTCLLSPALLAGLAAAVQGDAPRCRSLRIWVTGGLLSPAERDRARALLSPHLLTRYGASETGAVAVADADVHARAPGAVGRMLPWNRAQAVDESDRPLAAGERGFLRFQGAEIHEGYYDDPEASAMAFRDGWFYPGDIGRVTADGLLFVEGRLDEMLNVGGQKVNANDVDAALLAQPGVVEAAAFVGRAPDGAAVLLAAVVAPERFDEGALIEGCRTKLGVGPARIARVRALPRNAGGKVDRGELSRRARVSVGTGGER